MEQPITAVIGGLGVRGYEVYASYARRNPDKIRRTASMSGMLSRRWKKGITFCLKNPSRPICRNVFLCAVPLTDTSASLQ